MSLWLGAYLGGKPKVAADGQGWVQDKMEEQLPSCDIPTSCDVTNAKVLEFKHTCFPA